MDVVIAFLLALPLVPLARWAGSALGLTDRPVETELKIHPRPISFLGGAAVVVATIGAPVLLGKGIPPAILAAVALSFTVGLVDDIRPLPPAARVVLLLGSGALVAIWIRPDALGAAAGIGVAALVLASANAVNLLDGQDGLVGGAGAIAALGLAWILLGDDGSRGAALALSLCGSLLAFLVWNRPPASIFLGNGGAYAVGTALAIAAADETLRGGWSGLLAAGACLGVFAFELVFTVARRLASRNGMASGDRLHSYDLVAVRHGRVRSTLLFWGLGAVAAGLGLIVRAAPLPVGAAIVGLASAAAAFWAVRLWLGRPRNDAPTAATPVDEGR